MTDRMDFMNGLVRRAAGKNHKTHEITALKCMLKNMDWLPLRVLILTSKVGQCMRKPLQWLQQDARKYDDNTEWLQKSNPLDLSLTLTPQKNTALHIAARFDKHGLATEVIKLCPSLISQANSEGDTPLHIAAKAGHHQLTEILIEAPGAEYRDVEEGTPCEVWKVRNLKGNNALQEALKKGHGEVALYLLKSYHEELGCLGNEAGESPLYLAAEAGLIGVVEELIKRKDYSVQGPDGQTPLHIAVIKGHLDIVETLLEKCECIDPKKADRFGQTALHYAAALGYGKITVSLVSTTPSLVYVFDNDGNSPLHIIAKRASRFHDHIQMAVDILHNYPCAAEQVDREGRNALHLAVMKGNLGMLKCLLKQPELKVLINEPDGNGNTPLHLAVTNIDFGIVKTLLQMGADSGVTNNDGLTALDVNELTWNRFALRQLFIHTTLKSYGATKGRLAWVERMKKHGVSNIADLKSVANTLSVVAALLATVTFAALFTVPGGYKNDGPEEGLPVFITRFALKAFLLSDTVALCCSLIVATLLIWAMMVERDVLAVILQLSFSLSWVAGSATMVALGAGIYTVLSDKLLWLAIVVFFLGCSSPFVVYLSTSYAAMTMPSRSLRL
ncbi:hypothetical protein AAC387_Pa10g0861 [Persea americana]